MVTVDDEVTGDETGGFAAGPHWASTVAARAAKAAIVEIMFESYVR
jgi:hypothetical protein